MTTVKNTDIDTLASEPSDIITLQSGFQVRVERLKTRQMMSLLKILTRGLGGAIGSILYSEDTGAEEFAGQLLGSMLVSIPEAEEETIEFIQRMVSPGNLIEDPRTKAEQGSNAEKFVRLSEELQNPELDDLLLIATRIVEVEAPHIQALGKNLAVLVKVKSLSDTAKSSSKKSPASSTSGSKS